MGIFNILTIFIGLATIIANICIARYNAGKNRKIYEIENLNNTADVNKRLENGDYTILYVGADFKLVDKVTYILGRVGSRRMAMNTKQLIVAWLMVTPICFVWVDWAINYFDPAKNITAALISTHIITIIIGGLLMYTLRNKKTK